MKVSLHWSLRHKFYKPAALLADRHYTRRKVGSPQFMPPGETIVLTTSDESAVFGWWRPHPDSGIKAMNGLDGWTCSIFRNEGSVRSSLLVLEAEQVLAEHKSAPCGPDGMLTYVWDAKLKSRNPGYCFKCAGWARHMGKPRSADGRKTLLHKPFELAGLAVPAPLVIELTPALEEAAEAYAGIGRP